MFRVAVEGLEARQLFAYDLVLQSLVAGSGTVTRGQPLTGTAVVVNSGDTPFPGGSVYFALTERSLNVPPDSEHAAVVGRLERVPLAPLGPGQAATVHLTLPVAPAFPLGSYFLSAVASERTAPVNDPRADVDFDLADANPQDNKRSAPDPIVVNPPPPAVGRGDSTFGQGGQSRTVLPLRVRLDAVAYDPLTGAQYAVTTGMAGNVPRIGALRLLPDGTVDPNFGSGPGGVLAFPTAPLARARTISRLADGSFLITGSTPMGDLVLIRLGADGSIVGAFGNGGVVVLDPKAAANLQNFDVASVFSTTGAPDDNHAAIVVGTSGPPTARRITAVKLTGQGMLDRHFGADGVAMTISSPAASDTARAATLLSDGRIIIAGRARTNSRTLALAVALMPNGAPDATFATHGRYERPTNASVEGYSAVAEGPTGAIYLAGLTGNANAGQLLVTHLRANGKPDTKFGTAGSAVTSVGPLFQIAASVLPSPDGGALVSVRTASTTDALASDAVGISLVRFTAAGTLLSTFGTNGILTVSIPPMLPAAATDADLDAFTESSAGEAQDVGGGKVRLLATDATDSTDSTTTLTATQLVADGVDLSLATTTIVSGAALTGKSGRLTVTLSNLGTLTATGKATYTVQLLTDLTDAAGITATITTPTLKLAPGTSKATTLKYKFPATPERRGYFLATDIALPTGQTDVDGANNRAAAAGSIIVGSPFTDLSFALAQPVTVPAGGGPATFKVAITNAGNAAASATGSAAFSFKDDAGLEESLGTFAMKGSIKPGATATVTIKALLPEGTAADGGTLRVLFSGTLVSLDITPANNFAESPIG